MIRKNYLLILIYVASLLIQLPLLDKGPQGQHVWRKVVGHAAAMNYYKEDNRFFYPRADIRLSADDTGGVYHELPITYWLTAQSYKLTGFAHRNAHIIALFFNLFLIFASFALGQALGYSRRRSTLFSFLMSFSPVFLYYAGTFVPNILGLSFFTAGLALWIPAMRSENFGVKFLSGVSLLILATLSKPTYLFYGLVLAFIVLTFWPHVRRKWQFASASVFSALTILGSNFLVIRHAKTLYESSPALRAIHTPIGPAPSPSNFEHLWNNIFPPFNKWFVEMFVGYAALLFFIVGVVSVLQSRKKAQIQNYSFSTKFWFVWICSFLIFACFFVTRFADHDYYLMSLLPLAAALSSRGAEIMLEHKKWKNFAVVLLVLVPILGFGRVYGRWYNPRKAQVPQELLNSPEEIVRGIPEKDLVLVWGDSTPIVFLYYLQRKGVVYSVEMENDEQLADEFKNADFQWLISYKDAGELPSSLKKLFSLEEAYSTEDFQIFKVSRF